MTFALTAKQIEARDLLRGQQTHTLFVGGSRSGKTFLIIYAIIVRALRAAESRHLIARFRFNHVITSIWHDTFPKVMNLAFPQVTYKTDKSAWFIKLPNGSEVWFGGLDEKERTEKVLGQEYATIFLNEVSQISWSSVETVRTRLAQKTDLRLKLIYDCNPPLATHWTHRLFVQKRQPEPPYSSLAHPEQYQWMRVNPLDNLDNLPEATIQELESLGAHKKQRFLLGEWGSATENALWTYELIEKHRVANYPDLQRVIIAIDPSGTKGEEDERSDEVGIIVGGLGIDGRGYIIEDLTCQAPPATWGRIAVQAYERHRADCIVGEVNYGGAMVEHVVRSAAAKEGIPISYREVHASRGKVVRAEPISSLYETGKIAHVGTFPELEDQLCSMTTAGYMGDRSPDRADAAIWLLSDLFTGLTRNKQKPHVSIETAASRSPHAW